MNPRGADPRRASRRRGHPRRANATAAAALCCALLAAPLAGPLAGSAYADSPSPGSGADPSSLPGISQVNTNFQQQGCVKSSGKATDRTPWAQAFLRPEGAWQLSRGAGVTVAVLGSGVDGSSGAFDGRLALGPRLPGTGDPGQDCVGHGTFLAGLIAAKRQNGLGFAGIAPEAKILSVAVTDEVGGTSADLLGKGIRAAADGGARVIVVAVPVPGAGGDLQDAVKYADAKGALVIAPAAADSTTNSAPGGGVYPSGYPDVLAVSDVGPGGAPPQSQNGTSSRVDLVAPGDSVMSVGPGGAGYFTGTGPSFATAFVAGTAALVLGYRPGLTREQLLHRLETTAYHPGTVMPDLRLGYGTVDPVAAVTAMLPEEQHTTPSTPAGGHDGGSMAMPPVEAQTAGGQAAAVAGGALVLVVLVGIAGLVLPRGSRRGWRPGSWVPGGDPVDGDPTGAGGATVRR